MLIQGLKYCPFFSLIKECIHGYDVDNKEMCWIIAEENIQVQLKLIK